MGVFAELLFDGLMIRFSDALLLTVRRVDFEKITSSSSNDLKESKLQ